MATIVYKGVEYAIQYKVSVINQGYGFDFYCQSITNSYPECLGNKDFTYFKNCYKVNRSITNNPLKIMRDFLLVRVPCRIEILYPDYKINLDESGVVKNERS